MTSNDDRNDTKNFLAYMYTECVYTETYLWVKANTRMKSADRD